MQGRRKLLVKGSKPSECKRGFGRNSKITVVSNDMRYHFFSGA